MKIRLKRYASAVILASLMTGCAMHEDTQTTPGDSQPAVQNNDTATTQSQESAKDNQPTTGTTISCDAMTADQITSSKTYIRNQLFNVLEASSLKFGIDIGLGFVHNLTPKVKQCVTDKVNTLIDKYDVKVEDEIESALYCPAYKQIQGKEINAFNTFMDKNPQFKEVSSYSIEQSFKELAKDHNLSKYNDRKITAEMKKLSFVPKDQKVTAPMQKALIIIRYDRLNDGQRKAALAGIDSMIQSSGCDIACMNKRVAKLKEPVTQVMGDIAQNMSGVIRPKIQSAIRDCKTQFGDKTSSNTTKKANTSNNAKKKKK